jgi:hypothetical protein
MVAGQCRDHRAPRGARGPDPWMSNSGGACWGPSWTTCIPCNCSTSYSLIQETMHGLPTISLGQMSSTPPEAGVINDFIQPASHISDKMWSYPWSSDALVPVSLVYAVFHAPAFIGILGPPVAGRRVADRGGTGPVGAATIRARSARPPALRQISAHWPLPGWSARKWLDGTTFALKSLPQTVTSREEVRPMNAVSMWVLPLVVTVGRLT